MAEYTASTGSSLRASPNLRQHHADTSAAPDTTEKFPDFDTSQTINGYPNGNGRPINADANASSDQWRPRRESRVRWAPRDAPGPVNAYSHGHGHSKQRSISNAIHRMRSGSMSQNAHEIAEALRAPVSYKLIGLCMMWYWSSALTNTSSKSILTTFDKPATLTLIQFAFVCSYCLIASWLASTFPKLRTAVPALKHPIRKPTRDVIVTTLPLAAFQIFGHLLSSSATSKIPVSLVHTIKGLSPLFTVLAYRLIFDIRYPRATYYSLVPLTVGVMLACSGKHSFGEGQFLGILYALLATIIFVTQNIFSKRLFNEAARAEQEDGHTNGHRSKKLDKLNLLCYSSGMAFILTCPIWLWSEGFSIIGDFLWDGSVDLTKTPNSFDHGRLTIEFIFNGTFHFGQNILAFVLLSMVSPVTYSVASLLKRVFVISIAIIWFRSPTTNVQAVGIALTFLGLYLYDRSQEKNKADQRARSLSRSKMDESILPLNTKQTTETSQYPPSTLNTQIGGYGYMPPPPTDVGSNKKDDGPNPSASAGGRQRGASMAKPNGGWLPPGTRQEHTWRMGDGRGQNGPEAVGPAGVAVMS
ncbi:triose-phosphate transporter family-domain-containing protein [Copromyces sp. CBS 386.78]|nr:triose-phosphate transporter family-domain-containing protein [Copromyces sp. CBS 386.78]